MGLRLFFLVASVFFSACGMPADNEDGRTLTGAEGADSGSKGTDPTGGESDPTAGGTVSPTGHKGSIISVSALGLVEGWAVNVEDLTQSVFVFFYVNGDMKTGTEVGSSMANLPGFDGSNSGDHRFSFTVPDQYRDGVSHQIKAYMEVSSGEEPIVDGKKSFAAFLPSATSRTFYDNTLTPQFQGNCTTCHSAAEVSFDNHFNLLLDPAPSEGGTATTNRLYLKASGQLGHGGGNRCSGPANKPCSDIAQWWTDSIGN